MDRLAGRPIITVGERVLVWEDVVIAAHIWGDITRLEARVAQTLAADRRLTRTKRAPTDAEVEDAADRWRYEHDLISADDLQGWLASRELTDDEWLDWVRREVSAERATVTRPKRPPADELEPLVFAELMCAGEIGEIVERLAGRAAISERAAAEHAVRAPAKARLAAAVDRLPSAVRRRGLFGLSAAETVKGAERIATMDAVYERFVKTASTEKLLAREIETHALEWTRVEGRALVFDAEGPAREAALLIRTDGLPIAKAGAVAKTPVRTVALVLEDVGGPLRDRLTSAKRGDLVGPVGDEDAFTVILVTKRVPPSVDDRNMRARAAALVERRLVGAEIEKRVRWHERF